MIYALQPVDGGPVKIGFTDDVDRRRAQLEAHYGRPLAILATMDGGRDEERAIHERFSHLRIGRTEQFRPAPDLMAFIGRPLLVDMDPDAIEALPGKPVPPSVKLDAHVVRDAKIVAAYKDVSLAEYLSEVLRPIVARDLDREHAKRTAADRPAEVKAPKGKGAK